VADIVLEPGEVFEHSHSAESRTTLLEGVIEFEVAGTTRRLCLGEAVIVPAGVRHVSTNVGSVPARIGCGMHGPVPAPEPG